MTISHLRDDTVVCDRSVRNRAVLVLNRSDGRVVWSSASGSVDSGFDSESGQTNDFKIGIHSFPA